MANPLNRETSTRIFRIWKFLPKIHLTLFQHRETIKRFTKERSKIQLGRRATKSLRRIEKMIHWRTSFDHAWPYETIPNQMRRFKVRIRSSPDAIRLKWRPTSLCIYFKDIFTNWKELRNIRSRTLSNYSSSGRMATLHSRIPTHYRSEERV